LVVYWEELALQVRERLREDVDRYDVGGIVEAILDRCGYVTSLDHVDAELLHVIFAAFER